MREGKIPGASSIKIIEDNDGGFYLVTASGNKSPKFITVRALLDKFGYDTTAKIEWRTI